VKITKEEKRLLVRALEVSIRSGVFFFNRFETEKLRDIKNKIRNKKKANEVRNLG